VVRHLLAGMTQASVEAPVLNVCTGRGTSIRLLAMALRDISGSAVDIRVGEARPGDIRSSVGSPRRAIDRLWVIADTPLTVGLTQTFSALAAGAQAKAA
jgi:UDP-glucose 4-epimerase